MNALKQLRSSTGTFELISYLSIEGSKLREVKKTFNSWKDVSEVLLLTGCT